MIKKLSLKALEKTMNTALALDPTTPSKLTRLNGKVLEMIVEPLDVHFFMTFCHEQLILLPDTISPPDTTIRSNPLGFIKLSILPASKARSLFNDEIKISGNIELGQEVKKIVDELDIDWEGHLSHFTGDVIAYQIGSLVRRGVAFKKRMVESMCHHVTDYLQEELRTVPPKEEIYDFFHAVDMLVNDVERLDAYIRLLIADHLL